MKHTAWIVNQRGPEDDQAALELCQLKEYASSPHGAWKNFLALVGKDRSYWNKLNYVAQQVEIEIKFLRKD